VEGWVREAERARPWLVAVRGKAKADYYSQEKVVGAKMRFYNAFPRQVMLLMQQATQVMEQNARNILTGGGHSGIGVSLVRGGAADLVGVLDLQLRARGRAYVHVGDDSWVVLRDEKLGRVHMFALDCSNFDLTQHGSVTKAVHEAVHAELRCVDAISADLWLAYARERLVVVTGSLVRRFRHAGPSGMPLQSKVNDVLMDVMVSRTLLELGEPAWSEDQVARAVEKVGRGMGFTVRLEQYWSGQATSLVEALEQRPFLFIGYYFHVRGGQVLVCCDVPRTFAQVPFPSLRWCKSDKELQVMEAMRLGSICLNLGMPTRDLEASFAAFRGAAVQLIERTVGAFGDSADERLRWAVQESPFGTATLPSLSGLLRVLRAGPEHLWAERDVELPSHSSWLPATTSWAEEMDREEEEEAAALGLSLARPLADLSVRAVTLPRGRVPTHPVTAHNDGRPPPTAVWTPARPPREAPAPSRRGRRLDFAGLEYRQALQDELDARDAEWSEDDLY